MKFAYFDQAGRVETAHNDDTLQALPTGAVALTATQFDNRFDLLLVGSTLTESPIVKPAPTLADLKTAKKAEITANFEQTIQQITAGYPASEIASWSKQEQEARAFTAVPLSATPLIDALANTRGVPKVTLAARIIAKADFFAGISGQLIGKRQGLEDSIDAATSKTALAAIAW